MHTQDKSPEVAIQAYSTESGSVYLFFLALTATTAFSLVAWILASNFLPHPEVSALIRSLDLVYLKIQPEPVENLVFICGVAFGLSSMGIAAYYAATSRFKGHPKGSLLLMSAWTLFFLWWLVNSDFYSLFPRTPGPLATSVQKNWLLFLVASVVFAFALGKTKAHASIIIGLVFCVLIGLLSLNISSNADPYLQYPHDEVVAFPIVQDWLGKKILLDQQSQYGLYPFFLRPLWHIFELSTFSLSVVMTLLSIFSLGGLIYCALRNCISKAMVATFCLGGIATTLLCYAFWPAERYFQFFPLRTVFPAIALAAATAIKLTPGQRLTYLIVYSLLFIGCFWNVESGIISVAAFFGYRAIVERSYLGIGDIAKQHLPPIALAAAIAIAVGNLYFFVRFGVALPFAEFTFRLKLYAAGIDSLPMHWTGLWVIHLSLYFAGVFVAIQAFICPVQNQARRASLLAFTVIGLFFMRYYQGRSSDIQLLLATWPAFIVGAILIDELVSKHPTPRVKRTITTFTLLSFSTLFTALTIYLSDDPVPYRSWQYISGNKGPHLFDQKIDAELALFENLKTSPNDQVLLMAGYAHLFQLRYGRPHPVGATGICLLWHGRDIEDIKRALVNPNTRLLISDSNPICGDALSRPDLNALIDQQFLEIPFSGPPGPRSFLRKSDRSAGQ